MNIKSKIVLISLTGVVFTAAALVSIVLIKKSHVEEKVIDELKKTRSTLVGLQFIGSFTPLRSVQDDKHSARANHNPSES